jgi:signal recognition particle GTPase
MEYTLNDMYRGFLRDVRPSMTRRLMRRLARWLFRVDFDYPLDAHERLAMREWTARCIGMIDSMTPDERNLPTSVLANRSRATRIALGSGTSITEVRLLLKGYEQLRRHFESRE